jgi:peptidoglycan/LPS O-acetylase OafA/YrhL
LTPQSALGTNHSLPALTGLRGLAALWVLIYHAWVYVTPQEILFNVLDSTIRVHTFFSLGWSGVQLLFVLSGFLITLPYARANAGLAAKPRLFRYLFKRISRVFPAYYLQLFMLVLIAWMVSSEWLVDINNIFQYLLMLFVPPPIGLGSPAAINGVWWTLPIELSFYLLLPVFSFLASPRHKVLLMMASMLSMVSWRWYIVGVLEPTSQVPVWAYQLPGSMDTFGLGMLGAVLHVQYSEQRERITQYQNWLKGLLCLTPFVFIFLGIWMAEQYETYWTVSSIFFLWTPIFGSATLILILNCAQNQWLINKLLANKIVFYLGTVSYGIYLWHAPIGRWLLDSPLIASMEGYQFPRMALLMFCGSFVLASISWYLVEARAIARARKK